MIFLRQKSCLLLLPLLISLTSIAQYRVRKLQHKENKDLTFPILIGENMTVAKKINEYLQTDFFETTTSKTPETRLFEETRFISNDTAMLQTGYTSISYKIEINNAKLFSVVFEVEGMGAYPTYYKRYFSFDSKNGELLTADSVFTSEGIGQIKRILIENRDRKIKERILEIKTDDEKQFAEDSVFILERFTECNEEANEKDFFISKEVILFYKEDCFPHAWQSYGAGLDVVFSNKEIEKYLSAFGKKILLTK